jgi:hypothetical protein
MFNWYQEAQVCYVYLDDIQKASWTQTFERIRWFSRGWTLQELIAPRKVKFFDQQWRYLGSKTDDGLRELLANITSIPQRVLVDSEALWSTRRLLNQIIYNLVVREAPE